MNTLKSKKILKIKTIIKKNNYWKQYKNSFSNKKMLFILSKICFIFGTTEKNDVIALLEIELSKNINDENHWSLCFKKISSSFKNPFNNCDWDSFGKFMFYVWNHWEYWNKKSKKSIYTNENFNVLNNEKTKFYNKWLDSILELNYIDFNSYIRKVIELI